jgi:hypothetical protein
VNDDLYRFCIWCGCDCIDYDTIETPHLPTCPSRTGLYPVEQRDIEAHGMVCMDCNEPFAVGDFYVMRETEDRLIFEVVCVGCGALAAVANGA